MRRAADARAPQAFDVERGARADFPCLAADVHGRPLVYLDSAASAQKPQRRDRRARALLRARLRQHPPRRATSSASAPPTLHEARASKVQRLPRTPPTRARSCSRATPPRASTWWRRASCGRALEPGDEILITGDGAPRQHRALAAAAPTRRHRAGGGADQRRRRAALDELRERSRTRTRLVSRHLGLERARHHQPGRTRSSTLAHARGVPVLVDGAQAVPHMPVDVQELDCDFFVFSGHKLYGPTGIGVLYGKAELLEAMPPYQGGGDMILIGQLRAAPISTSCPTSSRPARRTSRARRPRGRDRLSSRGSASTTSPRTRPSCSPTPRARCSRSRVCVWSAPRATSAACCPSSWRALHPHDIGTLLDLDGIAVRTGHHCAQPVMERLGHRRHGARLARPLQHARRHRRAGREPAPRRRHVCLRLRR